MFSTEFSYWNMKAHYFRRNTMAEEKEIALTELDFNIKDKIHTIRGIPVMLDSDLARIYGYDTRSFNKQIKNNARRFEGDEFSFLITEKEFKNLMCKKSTSSWGGRE